MNIHEVEQGTLEWRLHRLGKATASNFDKIVTAKGKPSTQAEPFMRELAADFVLGNQEEIPATSAMKRGTELEPYAREWFCKHVKEAKEVGFVTSEDKTLKGLGCSPDGLISDAQGNSAGLEIKCPSRSKHCKYFLDGKLPSEYMQQVHGSMVITGLREWHFMSFYAQFATDEEGERILNEDMESPLDFALTNMLKPFVIQVKWDSYTNKVASLLRDFSRDYQANFNNIVKLISYQEPEEGLL